MECDVFDLPFPIHVTGVSPLDGKKLAVDFSIGREGDSMSGVFDMTPYLDSGVFRALQNDALFNRVRIENFTAAWPGDLDIAPERLYTDCVVTSGSRHYKDGRPL